MHVPTAMNNEYSDCKCTQRICLYIIANKECMQACILASISCSISSHSLETTTGIAVGIVFGIIVFVLAILAVCCSVLCLLRKRKKCSPLVIAIPSDSEGARSPSNTPIADLSLPQDVVHEVQTFPALGATIHSSMGRGPVTAMDDHLASVNEDNPTTMTSSTAELLPTPLSMVHTLPHLVIQVKPKSTQL